APRELAGKGQIPFDEVAPQGGVAALAEPGEEEAFLLRSIDVVHHGGEEARRRGDGARISAASGVLGSRLTLSIGRVNGSTDGLRILAADEDRAALERTAGILGRLGHSVTATA